jgi:hypothetical protein
MSKLSDVGHDAYDKESKAMASVFDGPAFEAAIDPVTQANRELERGAAAESAVRVVMAQLALDHPTRISVWTMREISRLLDALYSEPEGEIKLGGQTLGAGFVPSSPSKTSDAVDSLPAGISVEEVKRAFRSEEDAR